MRYQAPANEERIRAVGSIGINSSALGSDDVGCGRIISLDLNYSHSELN